jgi:hypothetical protein
VKTVIFFIYFSENSAVTSFTRTVKKGVKAYFGITSLIYGNSFQIGFHVPFRIKFRIIFQILISVLVHDFRSIDFNEIGVKCKMGYFIQIVCRNEHCGNMKKKRHKNPNRNCKARMGK